MRVVYKYIILYHIYWSHKTQQGCLIWESHSSNSLCSNLQCHCQLVSCGINTFQIGDNNEENNPMPMEENGPIIENPPANLSLKIFGRYESHNYKSLVFQGLTNVNPSVGNE